MNGPLTITLALDRKECIRGESVFFDVVIKNVSSKRIDGLPTLEASQRSVRLEIDGPGGLRTADQLSVNARDGVYHHAPRGRPPTTGLAAGQDMSLHDDLLSWFGELEPGSYQVTARHGKEAVSAPADLKVLPAAPLLLSTPRYAAQDPAPPVGAWAHKQGEGALLFYQQQSSTLPRNPIHGLRVAELKAAPKELFAATVAGGNVNKGHILWVDEKDHLFVATANLEKPHVGSGVRLDPPFKGRPLHSPLSMTDGSLFIPYADEKNEKVVILQVELSGNVQPHELDLGKVKPVGAYVCFWEYGARLHFGWAAPRGREVFVGRLPLDDPASGFPTRSVYLPDDPILWLDAYLDPEAATTESPAFEHQIPPDRRDEVIPVPPPKVTLWCVTEAANGLQCTRISVPDSVSKRGPMLTTQGAEDLRVLTSVVTYRFELAMLLADAKDQLYYASTVLGSMKPLSEVAKSEITLDHFPGLITAGSIGGDPWVYLRYVKDKNSIDYVRIEPPNEKDPVEREAPAKPGRRRGR